MGSPGASSPPRCWTLPAAGRAAWACSCTPSPRCSSCATCSCGELRWRSARRDLRHDALAVVGPGGGVAAPLEEQRQPQRRCIAPRQQLFPRALVLAGRDQIREAQEVLLELELLGQEPVAPEEQVSDAQLVRNA